MKSIFIYPENNLCSLCFKHYVYSKRYSTCCEFGGDVRVKGIGIKEVELITAHPGCRALLRKKKMIENDLAKVEWEIFQKMN